MSKGNLFLGQARGSVGDVTFTHIAGQQVARARNRSPRNPRVPSQMLQRIVLNSASKAYSLMQPIVNHSFEGVQGVARNQQRFMMLNTSAFRDKLAEVIANPTEAEALASTATSFSFKGDFFPQLNAYRISEGTLPAMTVQCGPASSPKFQLRIESSAEEILSYQDVIDTLNVQAGDQLTFIGLGHKYDDESYDQVQAFMFARVILEPASGDFEYNFIDSETDRVADPNPKNEGDVRLSIKQDSQGWYIEFEFPGMSSSVHEMFPSMVGGAVILSRFEAGRWRRSPQSIVPATFGGSLPALDTATFGAAYASYLVGDSSNLFLNGSPVAVAAAPAAAASISAVLVGATEVDPGDIAQNVVQNFTVQGTGLNSQSVRLVKGDTQATIPPTTASDTSMVWTVDEILETEAGYSLYVNGSWYLGFVTGSF